MSTQPQSITHWARRQTPDHAETGAASDMLRALFSAGALRRYRAVYYPPGSVVGVRQAVLIDLDGPHARRTGLESVRCLWLVEQVNGRVFLYGSDREPNERRIGGALLREQAVLAPESVFCRHLTEIAAQRASLRYCARTGACLTNPQVGLLQAIEQRIVTSAVRAFLAGLNAEALGALHIEGTFTAESYNHYLDADGTAHRNRVQAVQAFPLFGTAIRTAWPLRRAVDRGLPLARELTAHFGVQPNTIARARTLTGTLLPPPRLATILGDVDRLPADYRPTTAQDWQAYLQLAEALGDLARTLAVPDTALLRPFVNGWHAGRQTLARQAGGPFEVRAIYDMMQAAWQYGLYPVLRAQGGAREGAALADRGAPPAFFPLWFGRYSLMRLTEMAARWRAEWRRFSETRLRLTDLDSSDLDWSRLLPASAYHSDGYRVVELLSYADLAQEGRAQRHCVASYAAKCLLGDSAIYSIRDRATGQPLSTFEIGLQQGRPELKQHQGPDHEEPPPALLALAERFVNRVLARLPGERIAAVRATRRAAGRLIAARLDAPNTLQAALTPIEQARLAQLVAFAHPKEFRRLSPTGILALDRAQGEAIILALRGEATVAPQRQAA